MAAISIKELFEAMPQYADTTAIQGVDKTIQFDVTGEDAGTYHLHVHDGTVTTHQGASDHPDVTITTPADVWTQIATGQMNPAVAFMSGKFKIAGDMSILMAMQNWFKMPGA